MLSKVPCTGDSACIAQHCYISYYKKHLYVGSVRALSRGQLLDDTSSRPPRRSHSNNCCLIRKRCEKALYCCLYILTAQHAGSVGSPFPAKFTAAPSGQTRRKVNRQQPVQLAMTYRTVAVHWIYTSSDTSKYDIDSINGIIFKKWPSPRPTAPCPPRNHCSPPCRLSWSAPASGGEMLRRPQRGSTSSWKRWGLSVRVCSGVLSS